MLQLYIECILLGTAQNAGGRQDLWSRTQAEATRCSDWGGNGSGKKRRASVPGVTKTLTSEENQRSVEYVQDPMF